MASRKSRPAARPKYLYAVINGSADSVPAIKGVLDKKINLVTQGSMAAVVSDVKKKKIRPQRRNLAAHQKVLNTLLEGGTPLPVTFGVIADGTAAIKRVLSDHKEMLAEAFDRVRGKVEMTLRVSWSVPNIFEYFTDTHIELRQARDRTFGHRQVPSHDQKIELGSLFDRLLHDARDAHTATVEDALAGCCAEIERGKCRDEHRVMDLACLVARDAQAAFEKKVLEAANRFDNHFAFDFNGPWVPHSFVDLQLDV